MTSPEDIFGAPNNSILVIKKIPEDCEKENTKEDH